MSWFVSMVRWVLALMIAAALLFTVLLVQDAKAAPQCDSAERVLQLLADRYGEERVGEGSAGGGKLLIFAHPDGDTWSVVILLPDGQACLLASGADWTTLNPTPPGSET
ncbi:MAG: hypothetical protein MUE83_00960 [Tabrizicola sp.]|jgi:hypothetical protein|nr:hypothetical protein [Tabrizicola sp.]